MALTRSEHYELAELLTDKFDEVLGQMNVPHGVKNPVEFAMMQYTSVLCIASIAQVHATLAQTAGVPWQ